MLMGAAGSKLEKALGDQFPEGERYFGLENFGNTSYCNTILQALYFCVPFREQLLEYYSNNKITPETEENLLTCLADLFTQISSQKKKTGVIAPKRFVQRVKKQNELFRSYMHQDAHEFLNFLLNELVDILEKEANNSAKLSSPENSNSNLNSNSNEIANGPSKPLTNGAHKDPLVTWVHKCFQGILTNETRCLRCETVMARDETFFDLSLDVEQNSSITSCLKNFSSTETLNAEDKLFCDKCCGLQEAQKRMKIKKPPSILVIRLKRYKYIEQLGRYKKLSYRVVFPLELKLSELEYSLFAVVVHVGSGPNHDHYVSLVKSHNHWLFFDDENVEIIDEGNVQTFFGSAQEYSSNPGVGYILFYESQSNFTPQTQIQTLAQMPFEISFNSDNNNNPIPFVTEEIKLDSPIFDGVFANELGPPQVNAPTQSLMEFLPDSNNNNNYSLQEDKILNEPIVDLNPNLEKGESFSIWMSEELIGDDIFSEPIKSNSDSLWKSVETDGVLDDTGVSSHSQLEMFTVGPVISQDQLFSIVDYSPNWAYVGRNTKVLVAGKFLKRIDEVQKCKWSCMFGEIEVSADLLHDGTLRCYSPSHSPGRVPFYVTCSNRLACSEIREFEFRDLNSQFPYNFTENETDLSARLEKLLTLDPNSQQNLTNNNEVCNKINGLMTEEDEWSVLFKANESDGVFADAQKDERVEGMMKEKLRVWLLRKVNEEGKGPCVLDKEGQGAIHLAAALGFDWAVRPIITAGVSVNFRDAHGWTALHWAASCGRERTVVALIALGADPGALTDPTPEFPSGRTPADLASNNGHKGISGFLAESSLTSLLEILTLKDPNKANADLAQICKVKKSVRFEDDGGGNMNEDGSLKDSLSAVRNAAQAASRIYQEKILKEAEAEADVDDFMVELKVLWEDDTPMFGF